MSKKSDKLEFTFAALPHAVLRDVKLSHTAKLLYAAIRARCISQDYCQTPLAVLADDLNISVSQVNRLMWSLKEVGLVRSDRTVRVSKIYPIHPKYVYEDVLSPFKSIRKKPVTESHPCDSVKGKIEVKNGGTELPPCDSAEPSPCDSGIIDSRIFLKRSILTKVSSEVASQHSHRFSEVVECNSSAQMLADAQVQSGVLAFAGVSEGTAPHGTSFCMGDSDSVTSSGYVGPLRKPFSQPPTAIVCSQKAPQKRVDVNPFTGNSAAPVAPKKAVQGRTGMKKLNKSQELYSLWGRWRTLVKQHFNITLNNEHPVGRDIGTLKNLRNVCGDYETVFELMELVCTDWKIIQKNWEWLAGGSPIPTLRIIDVLKNEMYAITQGDSPLKTKHGHGSWYPKNAKPASTGGYEMIMME